MNSNTIKFISAVLLLGIWGVFAFLGKTPVDNFITAISMALTGLGIYHVSTSAGAAAVQATPPALPVVAVVDKPAPQQAAPQ